jgi:hypothetical protein
MGRLFVLAEFVGAFVLIATMWALVRLALPKGLEEEAREHSSKEEDGMMMCCAESDDDARPFREKIKSRASWRAVAGAFQMDVAIVWKELVIGFLIAGFLMALVPNAWWQTLFVSHAAPPFRHLENAVAGPIIAMTSFVCSVGNIPLSGWFWSNGINFGGVGSFIYADLIVLPIILIYRKYYGGRAIAAKHPDLVKQAPPIRPPRQANEPLKISFGWLIVVLVLAALIVGWALSSH